MTALYTNTQMRQLEQHAATQLGDGYQVMLRAAAALDQTIRERHASADSIHILCGPGNNGGDGYALASRLKAARRDVQVFALDGVLPARGDGAIAAQAWVSSGGAVRTVEQRDGHADLLVDALFGIGLERALLGSAAQAVEQINAQQAAVLSVDVPSGIDAETGAVRGVAVRATQTLTLLGDKLGLRTGEGVGYCGEVLFDPLFADGAPEVGMLARTLDQSLLLRVLPRRQRNSHKGSYGHVLVVGGDHGMGGAVRLAAEGASRAGAGLVSVSTRAAHVSTLLAVRPEIMARAVDDDADISAQLDRATALVVGPGLGQSAWGRRLLRAVLQAHKPTVLDADGLNLLAASPWVLDERVVLTPHPLEAARLLGSSVQDVQSNRVLAAMQVARRFNAAVVLKGAGSIVATPAGQIAVCTAGNPGLASGGTGDVLAGVIGALLAQGLSAADAAMAGTLVHARAADRAAGDGERGMLASDLFEHIRREVNP